MKNWVFGVTFCAILLNAFSAFCQKESNQLKIVRNMIEAVNQKSASQYVEGFSDTIKIYVDNELKLDGKAALQANRAKHFERYPGTRSEIQHLVEIDEKVIMHDKVWLHSKELEGQDIVEIFTFKDGMVVRMDVIQSKTLFKDK